MSQLLLPPPLPVASFCKGLQSVLEAVPENDEGWRARMPGSGGLGVPEPAEEVQSVPAPSVLCPPHPVYGQESLWEQEAHLLDEEVEGESSYACGPDLGGLDLKGKQVRGDGSS